MNVWLNAAQAALLLEAICMLRDDWEATREDGHPAEEQLKKIEQKLLSVGTTS